MSESDDVADVVQIRQVRGALTPPPEGRGVDGHWHGGPGLCPRCGGIRPDLEPAE